MLSKKIAIILITFVLVAFLIPTQIHAETTNSFDLLVSANKEYANAGETVELTLKVANIDVDDPGINTVQGVLEYDTNLFEEVEESNIDSLNNWTITYNSEDTEYNGTFLGVILQDGVTNDQEIGKIKLKVKAGAVYTRTTIKIKGITTNNGQDLIQDEDREIVLEVGKKQTVRNEVEEENTFVGENVSTGKLPQTGEKQVLGVVAGVTLIIFAIIMYARYKSIDK